MINSSTAGAPELPTYSFSMGCVAHVAGYDSLIVGIPDSVFEDQKHYSRHNLVFPVRLTDQIGLAMLDGDAYGLHTTGTGDPIVRLVVTCSAEEILPNGEVV